MTTAAKPLPEHVDNVRKDADMIGWDVQTTPSSLKITPPNGRKNQSISISLNPPPAPPQLLAQLAKGGFTAAVQAWNREHDGKAPQAPQADQPTNGTQVCPECKADGAKEPYTSDRVQSMATHRRQAHGVVGNSAEAKRRREQLAAAKKGPAPKKATSKPGPKKTAAAQKPASKAAVPAQRAEAAPKAEPTAPVQVNVDLLPAPVADAVSSLLTAVTKATGDTDTLRKEVESLRDFRTRVVELANDGTKAPVQVVSSILDLAKATEEL